MSEKTEEFFLVALPGLEDLVLAEVEEWFPNLEAKAEHGGVTVHAPLNVGLSLNLALKTPTRILLRVSQFRCRDFPKLFKIISALDWERWLDSSCELETVVSTRLSRLKIKLRISETCEDAWAEYKKRVGAKSVRGRKATLYVRFLNDECMLSLDTSGERLHKRGDRRHIGDAPLRETIAASLIQLVGRSHPGSGQGPIELVDPMMGSGTFLLEAETRDQLVEKRGFGFESFRAPGLVQPRLTVERPVFNSFVGFERDTKAMAAAKENLRGHRGFKFYPDDFFTANPLPEDGVRRWLFANPPYGERIKVKEPLGELYVRLFAAAERVVRPERACFLLPSKAVKGKFALPRGWKVLAKRPFLNGGIPVTAFVFGRE